jgi:hypothetical protein
LSGEGTERNKEEMTTEVLQTKKTQEEEKVKAERVTPVFVEHFLIDLIGVLERKTVYQVFPVQINNTQSTTKLYDCARRNNLSLTAHQLPDAGQPLTGVDGVVCGNTSKVLYTSSDEGAVAIVVRG